MVKGKCGNFIIPPPCQLHTCYNITTKRPNKRIEQDDRSGRDRIFEVKNERQQAMEQQAKTDDSLGAILSNAIKSFWQVLKKLWPVYLAVFIPLNIIYWLVLTLIDSLVGDQMSLLLMLRIANAVDKLLNGTVGLICVIATMLAIRDVEENREFTLVGTFKQSLSRWGVTFAALFLVGLATGLLTCFCIVPGIIFGIYFAFVAAIALFGDNTITGAFSASMALVKDRWWVTLGIIVVLGLLASAASSPGIIIGVCCSFPLGIVEELESSGESVAGLLKFITYVVDFLGTVVSGTFVDITMLFIPSGIVLLYLRRKARAQSGVLPVQAVPTEQTVERTAENDQR